MIWLVAAAFAEDAPPERWWLGLPVQSVQIVSPGGGVPEESLDPLLRVRQGQALDPGNVRLDLATLFHAGDFASLEADVQPWVDYDESGEPRQAVILRYLVTPAPRAAAVRVQGADALPTRHVIDAAAVPIGAAFFPNVDGPRTAARVKAAYAAAGFEGTVVEVDAYETGRRGRDGADRLEVWVRVDEGEPRTLEQLAVTGDNPVTEHRIRRVARRAGLAVGRPVTESAIRAAQYAVRADLAGPDRYFGVRPGGYIEARVTPAVDRTDAEGWTIALHVESGHRLTLDVDGLWPWPRSKAREALGIDERLRLTRGFVDEAPVRLGDWMARRGFRDARASVTLTTEDREKVLAIAVERGPRHHLTPVFGRQLRVDFFGNDAVSDADLRTVMEQASDQVLRYGWITDGELEKGLSAARDRYHASGYPSATFEIVESTEKERFSPLWLVPGYAPVARKFGAEHPVDVRVRVSVAEGALVRLGALEIAGAAPEVDMASFDATLAAMVDQPYSPQAIAELAQRVVVAHRDAGYLEADVRIAQKTEGDQATASIGVEAGPRVLLRSVVFTGAVRTRTTFLRRQLDLTLGEPLTEYDLAAVRRDLYDLSIFRTVQTELLGEGTQRDLLIDVVERARVSYELGGGLSTDQGARGFARVTRHNLWGLGHTAELFALAGLDYRSDSLTDWRFDARDPQWRAAATYTAPHFPWRNQRVVLDVVFREQDQERTWRMARSAMGLTIETALGTRTTLRTGIRSETRRLLEVDPGALLPGEPWATLLDPDGNVPLPSVWREQHTLTALVLHDRRDDPIQPTRGLLVSATTELFPGVRLGLWSDVLPAVWFGRAEARGAAYLPVGATTLHLSGVGAGARPFAGGTIPLEDRYRLGGTGNLRGFRRDAVGPRNEVDQVLVDWPDELLPIVTEAIRTDSTRWVSTGGDTLALASVEWLVPLPVLGLKSYEGYAAAIWAEAGNTWLQSATATSELPQYRALFAPPLRYAVGAGLRVVTPIGPLQIDLASNPAVALARGEVQKLLRDDWEEPAFRAHLSLGTLF